MGGDNEDGEGDVEGSDVGVDTGGAEVDVGGNLWGGEEQASGVAEDGAGEGAGGNEDDLGIDSRGAGVRTVLGGELKSTVMCCASTCGLEGGARNRRRVEHLGRQSWHRNTTLSFTFSRDDWG